MSCNVTLTQHDCLVAFASTYASISEVPYFYVTRRNMGDVIQCIDNESVVLDSFNPNAMYIVIKLQSSQVALLYMQV